MDRFVPNPIVFRGRTYASVEEMPAEVRQAYERALQMLDETVPGSTLDTWEDEDPGRKSAPGSSL